MRRRGWGGRDGEAEDGERRMGRGERRRACVAYQLEPMVIRLLLRGHQAALLRIQSLVQLLSRPQPLVTLPRRTARLRQRHLARAERHLLLRHSLHRRGALGALGGLRRRSVGALERGAVARDGWGLGEMAGGWASSRTPRGAAARHVWRAQGGAGGAARRAVGVLSRGRRGQCPWVRVRVSAPSRGRPGQCPCLAAAGRAVAAAPRRDAAAPATQAAPGGSPPQPSCERPRRRRWRHPLAATPP